MHAYVGVTANRLQAPRPYMEGDRIRVNDNYETVALGEATMYGLVKKVDFVSNITTV